ncbi:MAG: LysR family transcriptional regulator [Devosia sp.]|nr:LysR family transcriptional regulator [Devosia sp.]
MKGISLRQLSAVLAVHKTGRIVNAARELSLTQPAVSLQIQEAERVAGTPLFERTREGLRPTAAGSAVIEAALEIDETLRRLGDEISAIRGGRRGRLRLGVVSTAKYFAPAIMAAFMQLHPELEISLWVGNRDETIASLEAQRIDVALMGRPPREFPVRATQIGEHPFVIIAPTGHPLVGHAGISKQQIAEENFLVRERGSGTRTALDIFLSEIPGRIENIGVELGSNETIKQAVMAGLGVALISAHTIAQEIEFGRLAILDVEGLPIIRNWFSVSRADRTPSPAMVAFEAFLREHGRSFLPDVIS